MYNRVTFPANPGLRTNWIWFRRIKACDIVYNDDADSSEIATEVPPSRKTGSSTGVGRKEPGRASTRRGHRKLHRSATEQNARARSSARPQYKLFSRAQSARSEIRSSLDKEPLRFLSQGMTQPELPFNEFHLELFIRWHWIGDESTEVPLEGIRKNLRILNLRSGGKQREGAV